MKYALYALLAFLLSSPVHAGSMTLLGAGAASAPTGPCAQATTYLARTSGGTEGGNASNITTLICGLVTDGVITGNLSTTGCGTTLDTLYILAQQNATDAKLNLCSTSFSITTVAVPTFTTFRGYNGFNSGTNNLSSNFNSTTAPSPNFTQNSGSLGIWSVAVTVEGVGQMGTHNTGATGESNLYDDFTGSVFFARVTNGTITSVPNPGSKGLFVAERPSSTNVIPYWDGVAQATQTGASQTPFNGVFFVGNGGSGGGTLQQIAEAHIGASLGATLNLALYNRLRTYMTAVGVP